jgi:hypothetical protein
MGLWERGILSSGESSQEQVEQQTWFFFYDLFAGHHFHAEGSLQWKLTRIGAGVALLRVLDGFLPFLKRAHCKRA